MKKLLASTLCALWSVAAIAQYPATPTEPTANPVAAQTQASSPVAPPVVPAPATPTVAAAAAPTPAPVAAAVQPAAPAAVKSQAPAELTAEEREKQAAQEALINKYPNKKFIEFSKINTGDTAWLLSATTLVILMVFPGLALFYAGMSRKKHTISTAATVLATAVVAAIMWVVIGYSLAFGSSGVVLGGFDQIFLNNLIYDRVAQMVSVHPNAPSIPEHLFMMFQLSFAVITPALIVGAFVERIRFLPALIFAAAWSVLVYAPVAHWVWADTGFLFQLGVLDFAGGLVVHINSGIAGLVFALMLKERKGHLTEAMPPSNLVLTMAGAGLLLVGWFGFNAGSAGGANVNAALSIANTMVAAVAGSLAWMVIEWIRRGFPSLLGMASGIIAGLVAVTPACGFVTTTSAMIIGVLGGASAYFGCSLLKRRLGYDDSLDAFGVHGIAGIVGSVLTGVFASAVISKGGSILTQSFATLIVAFYAAIMTAIILFAIKAVMPLRSDEEEEEMGLDIANHAEQLE